MKLAENYVKSGSRLYVQGRLSYGTISSKGQEIQVTSIIADDIIFLSKSEPNSETDQEVAM